MPDFIHIERKSDRHLAYVWMDRPPLNVINHQFMDEMIAAHNELAADDDIWQIILASRSEKFYSNGLDPELLLSSDVAGRGAVFTRLLDMLRVMYAFPKISVACIQGHAMAGGAVIGIAADFRFMGDGKYRYAFSEVPVGLTIPLILLKIIERTVGPHKLRDVAMLGQAFTPAEAKAIGLVDEVWPERDLYARTESYLAKLLPLSQRSLRNVKRNIRAPIVDELEQTTAESLSDLESFLSGNFEEGLRAILDRRRPDFQNP
ncbi:MAG: enoyl-CoA hydratase/isomerase family protein [Leptospiraceae bacterium]|nr:enoyl-CoA hydratase/isomerase family protein [Leptospiraceae bacterium]MCB1323487.1 enoyl-CoA hydratase/isomerase family protein [Leptospiraceae bacterium]